MVSHAAVLTGEEGSEWSHRSCIVVRNTACALLHTARQLDENIWVQEARNLRRGEMRKEIMYNDFVIKLTHLGHCLSPGFGYTSGK